MSLMEKFAFVAALMPIGLTGAFAQEAQEENESIDEVVIVGTQIKGAGISEALAVTVMSSEDIEILGVESGDELLDLMPENGQNFVNEAESISGGVNAARGDVGAVNLRNMGTGNTLVLLNGRRLVNSAAFQTEKVGGDFVPVNSVNTNHIPVFGLDRVEVLRDGASAIYGADAVAGVVNTVLKNDFEGLTIRAKYNDYENIPRNDEAIAVEWGKSFNGGATNFGVFARHYRRDRVNAQDDKRWANSDLRSRLPDDSPYASTTQFRNDSSNSLYGQFDVIPSASGSGVRPLTDSRGEFEVFPLGDARCEWTINAQLCGAADGNGTIRYNLNDNRDLASELDRTTIYAYLTHEMNSGMEAFSEFYYYQSHTELFRQPSQPFSTVKLEVGAQNYYNPFGPCTSPNRINPAQIGEVVCGDEIDVNGVPFITDFYRFAEAPRVVDNDGDAIRILQGFRGEKGAWDWESAVVWSRATKDDVTHNRISNTLMQEALNDPTSEAYNPFAIGVGSNIERALIDVKRLGETTYASFDAKFSNAELFEMPAGSAAFLIGVEWRRETFEDDRDDRLDGTIAFIDRDGDTYPEVSDVMTSSPTPDGKGDRDTTSVFAELQLPVFDSVDVQLAVRYEEFSDIQDSTTVPKIAIGWRPIDQLLFRGSWSEAFRAPNMVTINEEFIARSGTRNDWVCFYAADNGGLDADDFSDCDYSIQRQATGSKTLKAEESTNTSIGAVLDVNEHLTITLDYWAIEKEDTIGLFGRENHTLLDLALRLQEGTSDCANVVGNVAVRREAPDLDAGEEASFIAAGLCPVGQPENVGDTYANLDTRTVEGHDIGLYWDFPTSAGDIYFRYNGSFYDKYEQKGTTGNAALLAQLKAENPTITYPTRGLGNLLRREGNQRNRQTVSISWDNRQWGASVSGFYISNFYQVMNDESRFQVPSMTTYNAKLDYSFDIAEVDTRVRLGVNNLTNERAPLYDTYFGFSSDAHRDYGRYYYVDIRARF